MSQLNSDQVFNYFKTGKCLLFWTDCTSATDREAFCQSEL